MIPAYFWLIIIISRSENGRNTEHVKAPLENYMAQYPKVKIVRLPKREGLIRARLLGLEHATAPVVTYLDSHCECTEGQSRTFASAGKKVAISIPWGQTPYFFFVLVLYHYYFGLVRLYNVISRSLSKKLAIASPMENDRNANH